MAQKAFDQILGASRTGASDLGGRTGETVAQVSDSVSRVLDEAGSAGGEESERRSCATGRRSKSPGAAGPSRSFSGSSLSAPRRPTCSAARPPPNPAADRSEVPRAALSASNQPAAPTT